ncbi:hypothetical protein LIER_03504 [Lithospermum erythrorhizon]|uniref:Uncharacterized protein n=1 Tax=Lithospermum erythrorhizon TaxID=34254 RepID=A0AAV3NTE3_LITER
MISSRCKILLSQTLKNPSIYHHLPNPHLSFSYAFSSRTLKPPENTNAISDYFVQKHQFSNEVATKAASLLTQLKTPETCETMITFFEGIGFSKSDLQTIVSSRKGPNILCARVDKTIKPKIKIFQDLGFSDTDIVCIITANPWLLMHSANNRIFPSLSVLKNVLGSVDLVARLLKVSAWFFQYDLEKTLIPNIEFLNSCGISLEQLTRHIFNFPRFFLLRPESVKKYVQRVDEMRFPRKSKLYIYAITCLASMSVVTWERKLEVIRSLGITHDQIFVMFQRKPHALAGSQGKITGVVQVIRGSRLYDLADIVQHPGVLTASIEKRLKPRLEVIEILESRNLIQRRPGFSAVHLITDKVFIGRFVTPYQDQLGDTYFLSKAFLNKGRSGRRV